MTTVSVDPRSYHIFRQEGRWLLFDRATGVVAETDAPVGKYLHSLRKGQAGFKDEEAGQSDNFDIPSNELDQIVDSLLERGFFRYHPVDHAEQDRMLESLLSHRSRRVQLLMAQGCNLGCRYCYAWRNGSNQKGTLMSFEIARQAVDFLVKRSGNRESIQVTFFGGEPLLNYGTIRQVVAYCRDLEKSLPKKFVFELITNGVLLTPEVTDWIVSEKFLLMISLDGWEEMHNYNRPSIGKTNEHAVIVRHALYANDQYQRTGLGAVKIRANLTDRFHDSKAVHDYLRSLGFTNIGLSVIEKLPHGDNSPSCLSEDQLDEAAATRRRLLLEGVEDIENGRQPSDYALKEIRRSIAAPETRQLKGVTCGVNRNTAVVDNKGYIYPCHRYEGMAAYVVGNVFTGMDPAASMDYYRKVNRNATSRCHSCWLRDYCAGGCAWLLSAKDGTIHDPTERECNRRREGMELSIHLRQRLRGVKPEWFDARENHLLESFSLFRDTTDEEVASCGSGECGDCGSGCGS